MNEFTFLGAAVALLFVLVVVGHLISSALS